MEGDRENMGVLDRLENLGQELSAGESELHKIQTPTEVFIEKLKSKGYNMEEMAPVLRTQGNQLIISGAGSGKALSNDTKVRTPDGFKPIGEMQVGDLVIGGDGNPHKVSGVFPQGKKTAYKIVLSDGQTILCCKDHLWNVKVVRNCNNKNDAKIGTYSTRWLHSNFNNSTFVLEMVGDCVEDIEFTEEMSERLTEITREAAIEKYNTGKTMYECLIKRLINEDIQLRRHYVNIVLESEFVFNKVGDGKYKFNSKKYSNIVLEFFKELTKSVGYTVDEKGIFSKKPLEIMEIKKTLVEKEMTCITVDSPDHTFVIEDWVVTHNTTTLIFKIMYDIISGEATKIVNINDNNIRVTDKIWVSTFLKSGAEELKKRLGIAQTEMGYFDTSDGIVFSTLHAEFKRALTAMGVKLNLMSNSDCISMIKKTADSLRIRHKNGKNLTQEDYFQIQGIITYARNRLDNKRYDNPACEEYGITPIILDSLIDGYKKRRDVENKHDFEDLQELLYDALYTNPNPAVQKFISERYNYIYLDEFQDTSQIQYAILKWYGVNYLSQNTGSARGKIVAVGDPQQCLVKGTQVLTNNGYKPIECLDYTDKVVSMIGKGDTGYCTISSIRKRQSTNNDCFVTIETESGKTIKGTSKHIGFAKVVATDYYYTYLMYKEGFGFRVGQTKGTRDAIENNGLITRLHREKADKGWLLDVFETRDEAEELEKKIKEEFGIPTYMFNPDDTRASLRYNNETVGEIFNDASLIERGNIVLSRYGLDFDYPHYIPKATRFDKRNTINISMLSQRFSPTTGVYASNLEINSYDEDFMTIVGKYLNLEEKEATTSGTRYWRARKSTTSDIGLLTDLADDIVSDCDKNDIYVEVVRKTKLSDDDYFLELPLGSIKRGMQVPVIDESGNIVYDTVVSSKFSIEDIEVFDIDVDNCHNFIANGIGVHNCIYTWRGSDNDIIEWQFTQDFNPTENCLSTNYRCPSNILNPVIPSIKNNKTQHEIPLKSSKEGGEMYAYSFADNRGMIMRLMNDIEEDLQKGYNIVILCRTNFDGMIPAFTLEQQHRFDFSISGTNMTLNSALPRSIFRCASLFTERSTNAVRQSLELLVGRQNAWKIKEFVYVLQNDKESIFTIDLDDIKFSVPFLYDLISTLREYRDRNEDIEGLKYLYNYMVTEVYQGDSTYCENARAYIELLLVIIDTHNFDNVFDFCEKIQEYSDNLVLRVGKPKVPIQIATVHEYKGKERDSVYIWNDSTDIFPSKRADLSNEEELEEERRVHYIAWTRAKKKLTVYAKRGQQGRFLIECKTDVKNGEIIGGRI